MQNKLRLVIDTGTWLKLDKLLLSHNITIKFVDRMYNIAEIVITHEIEQELVHFSCESWQKTKTVILPITKQDPYIRALHDGFDPADSSILGIDLPDSAFIITEDRPLIKYCKLYRLPILFFVEFLAILCESHLITKNDLSSLNHDLYSLRNINKALYQRFKEFAQHF